MLDAHCLWASSDTEAIQRGPATPGAVHWRMVRWKAWNTATSWGEEGSCVLHMFTLSILLSAKF